ncbi:MAG: hypothetical protein ACLSH1_04510 [Clostridia bacterium]
MTRRRTTSAEDTSQTIGIEKIGQRFVDSIDHAAYTLNGAAEDGRALP